MSSYHTSFSYNGENSLKDKNLIIVAFEPDEGFTDSFLSMDNVSDNYFDGTKRFDYGSKYNTSAEVKITVIKKDGTDMALKEFRSYAKWLTGARLNSWLDMYVGDSIVYSFLGKFLNLEPYKLDARTVGCRLIFSSVSPWAYSVPQTFNCSIGQSLSVTSDGVLIKGANEYSIVDNGFFIYYAANEAHNIYDDIYFWIEEMNVCGTIPSVGDLIVDPHYRVYRITDIEGGTLIHVQAVGYVATDETITENNGIFIYNLSEYDATESGMFNIDAFKAFSRLPVINDLIITSNGYVYSIEALFENTNSYFGRLLGTAILIFQNVFGFDSNDGVLYYDTNDSNHNFNLIDNEVVGISTAYQTQINNQSDDLYTYIYLDIDYTNKTGDKFSVKNKTLNEETIITGLSDNEVISLSSKQFIVSDIPNKIFGDSFNFVWPRLAPGINDIVIDGSSQGLAQFTYRYPMKVGDCTMDIDVYGSGIDCGSCSDGGSSGGTFTGTIAWKDITNTPTTIEGYGITDAYTMDDVDNIVENIEISGGGNDSVNINEADLNAMLNDILQ